MSSCEVRGIDQRTQLFFVVAPGNCQRTGYRWRGAGEVGEGGDDDTAGEVGEKGRGTSPSGVTR